MEKVTLTKEQAKSLEDYMKWQDNNNETAIHDFINNHRHWISDFKPLADMGLEKFILSLYIGYEVELTNEELFAKEYHRLNKSAGEYNFGQAGGMLKALTILGIKIEGVNT